MSVRSVTSMTLLVLVCASLPAQPLHPESGQRLLSGFARDVAGEHIDYHSFHPYASGALLTRCLDGKRVISWQTETIPTDLPGGTATFVWIAAHSSGTSTADRLFHVDLNGTRWFSFTTVKDRRVHRWTVEGKDGARLSFDGKWEDTVEDLFGYVYLQVPLRNFPPGKPVTVSIVGDSAASRDWYMTFTYVLRESLTVRPQQALLRTPGGNKQLIDILIDHVEPAGSVLIESSDGTSMKGELTLGFNTMQLAVDQVTRPRALDLTVAIRGRAPDRRTLMLRPVIHRELWFLPHSHNDIGYSDLQADVEKKQIKNLRDAIALFRSTASYGPEARFRWNSELLWAVDRFLATCSAAEREGLIRAVKEGGIGLNALYANQLTGICRPEELLRLTDYARTLSARYGVTINDAMVTDIPGFTWATVPALAQGGIRYFSSGPNYMTNLPDGGDRIGSFSKAWGDRPFYWVSPSGQEKVLFWVTGRGYSWFHNWLAGTAGAKTAGHIFEYMRELDERGYPYDMVQVRYTIHGDNGPVDPGLPEFVKKWNETYVSPKLVIATASAMFQEFERRWGATLPSYAGDITPYWEDGALSTLRELGLVRRSSERLIQAAAAASILGTKNFTASSTENAWTTVHLFDEHTWGAWNSVSDPDNPFAVSQLTVKLQYAHDADRLSRDALALALESRGSPEAIDVINTLSWSRTDLVVLSPELSSRGDAVVDERGVRVPSQRLRGGELAFLAADVPPLGARRYTVQPGSAPGSGSVSARAGSLSNGILSVEFDARTGAVRSLRTSGGVDLADTSVYPGLNQYLYVSGRDPAKAQTNASPAIEVTEAGPLVGAIRVRSQAPGAVSLLQEYRLVEGLARLDIVNTIDKLKVRDKESVHIAFPLRCPSGVFRLDAGWGVLRPEADQLPGSCKDYFSTGRWVDVSNQDFGVTWTTVESPLVEIGAMTDESPATRTGHRAWRTTVAPGTTFYSYAMNNYWHTNYAADQEGPATLSFALHPHAMFNAGEAYCRGAEQGQMLLVRAARTADPVPGSLFTIDSRRVVTTMVGPSADGKALMVRLYNAGGAPEEVSIDWGSFKPRKIFLSSLGETRDGAAPRRLTLPAYGILTLRCEK